MKEENTQHITLVLAGVLSVGNPCAKILGLRLVQMKDYSILTVNNQATQFLGQVIISANKTDDRVQKPAGLGSPAPGSAPRATRRHHPSCIFLRET